MNEEKRARTASYLLFGALALTIAVAIGWLVTNLGHENDTSGMEASNGISSEVGPTADFPVRSIDEILESDFEVDVDPSGTAAVLRLTTTIDVACSVVYGTTTEFGGLATDTDMAGGGHREHQPLMTGLEPGTTVLYRAQGTDAAGNIYVGDIERFVVPGADGAGAASVSNLALDGTVTDVSGEFNDNFAAANAIDGSLVTEWSSRGDGDDAFIVIDLGATQDVTGIGFRTREMGDGTAITNSYVVIVDGGDPLGPFPAGPGLVTSELETTGRVFRIEMDDTTGGNTGAVEIEIYGS